jgi:hypothetical protein
MAQRQRLTNEQKKQYLDFLFSFEVKQLNIPKINQQTYYHNIFYNKTGIRVSDKVHYTLFKAIRDNKIRMIDDKLFIEV